MSNVSDCGQILKTLPHRSINELSLELHFSPSLARRRCEPLSSTLQPFCGNPVITALLGLAARTPPGAAPMTPQRASQINSPTINAPIRSVQYKFLIATIRKDSLAVAHDHRMPCSLDGHIERDQNHWSPR